MTPEDFTNGHCDSFALAMKRRYPHLRLVVIGHTVEEGEGFWPTHYLVHDNEWAYDAKGSYDLTQPLSETFGTNVEDYNSPFENWFGDELEPENGDYRAEATILINQLTHLP